MTNRHAPWLILAACLAAGACVREKETARPEKTPAPTTRPQAVERPIGAYDLDGKRRARPRATMGALEAEPRTEPPKKPQDRDRPAPRP